jgi:hypothetical protein
MIRFSQSLLPRGRRGKYVTSAHRQAHSIAIESNERSAGSVIHEAIAHVSDIDMQPVTFIMRKWLYG